MSLQTANLERWRQRCAGIPGAVREDIKAVLNQNADEFMDKLRNNLPHQSGDLVDTVRKNAGTGQANMAGDKDLTVTVSMGDAQTPYGPANEFGHFDGPKGSADRKHVPAQPVFFPALRVLKKKLRSRMKRVIGKSVAKMGGDPPADGTS